MKALLIVEVIVVLVIHFFASSESLWATPVTALAFILLTTQLGWKRIPLCIGITLLWGYVFWKLELGWFMIVLYSILLLVANWQIVKRIEDDEFTE